MKFCYYCGSKIPDDGLFCGNCGKKITLINSSENILNHAQMTQEKFYNLLNLTMFQKTVIGCYLSLLVMYLFEIYQANHILSIIANYKSKVPSNTLIEIIAAYGKTEQFINGIGLLCFVLYLIWIYKTYTKLKTYSETRYSATYLLIGHFIPFVNLFISTKAYVEIWNKSISYIKESPLPKYAILTMAITMLLFNALSYIFMMLAVKQANNMYNPNWNGDLTLIKKFEYLFQLHVSATTLSIITTVLLVFLICTLSLAQQKKLTTHEKSSSSF